MNEEDERAPSCPYCGSRRCRRDCPEPPKRDYCKVYKEDFIPDDSSAKIRRMKLREE